MPTQSIIGDLPVPGTTLVVDLDHTLIRTDILLEQILKLIATRPSLAFALPFWFLFGRAKAKSTLSDAVSLDVASLPYRPAVIGLIERCKATGSRIVLATGTHHSAAAPIAKHLGLFDDLLASETFNMKGQRKLDAIRQSLGGATFAYVGDAPVDVPIWRASSHAVAVNPSAGVRRSLAAMKNSQEIFYDRRTSLLALFKLIRPHQWLKNILVAVPVVAGHWFTDATKWRHVLAAFIAFSLTASFVYVLNDLMDVEADRRHRTKRARPLASGDLSIAAGAAFLGILGLAAAAMWTQVATETWQILLLYVLLNVAYSVKLKKVLAIDTIVLASFYTMRILAGAAETGVAISSWLLTLSLFFFFGLAMVKRYTEISVLPQNATTNRRSYDSRDGIPVLAVGVASSFLAILILALYLNNEIATHLYRHPDRLWYMTPIMAYWTSRLWLLAGRGKVHDDPVIFALRDVPSWISFAAAAGVLFIAL